MNGFDKMSHNSWLTLYHTRDVIKRLEIIRDNLLKHAAQLADKTNLEPGEVHKYLIKANTFTSMIELLNQGDLDNITDKLV